MRKMNKKITIIISLIIITLLAILYSINKEYNYRKELYSVLMSIDSTMIHVVGDDKFKIGKDSAEFMKEIDSIRKWIKDGDGISFNESYENYQKYEAPAYKNVSSFYINKYQVTQKQWEMIMGYNPIVVGYETTVKQDEGCFSKIWRIITMECRKKLYEYFVSDEMNPERKQHTAIGEEYPIYYISWSDAIKFIDKLNELNEKYREQMKKEYGEKYCGSFKYKLPNEIEWEYAARGGINWKDNYVFSGSNKAYEVAWFDKISKKEIHKVGGKPQDLTDDSVRINGFYIKLNNHQLKPNQLGLYDMSGNIYEWCSDKGIRHYQNDTLIHDTTYRMVRGGGYALDFYRGRVSYRGFGLYANKDAPEPDMGFRLAADRIIETE